MFLAGNTAVTAAAYSGATFYRKGNAMQATEYLVHGSIAMTRGSLLRVEDGRDLLVYVWAGSIWLTQEGEARDRYLAAGEWFRLDRNGVAIAYSMRRTVLSLTAPAPEFYARRIVLARAGASAMPVELYASSGARSRIPVRLRRAWTHLFTTHARPTGAAL
jgi:hypothetical protein